VSFAGPRAGVTELLGIELSGIAVRCEVLDERSALS
jgi:hypothetical protein